MMTWLPPDPTLMILHLLYLFQGPSVDATTGPYREAERRSIVKSLNSPFRILYTPSGMRGAIVSRTWLGVCWVVGAHSNWNGPVFMFTRPDQLAKAETCAVEINRPFQVFRTGSEIGPFLPVEVSLFWVRVRAR
ncbi:hypothetical protein V8E55_009956 [Tylopilus felleus]